jgi:hypothetical protein
MREGDGKSSIRVLLRRMRLLTSCYERQIAVFESDSEAISSALAAGPCKEPATTVGNRFGELEEQLMKIEQFDNTWSGFAIRVELAETKNKSLALLASECLPARKDAK